MKKKTIFMIVISFILGAYGSRICQAMDDYSRGLGNVGMFFIVCTLLFIAITAAFSIEIDDDDDYDF